MAKRITLKDVEYVTLVPDEFVKEFADQVDWGAIEMGCYWILNFNLYTHGGKLDFDLSRFAKLCRMTDDNFVKVWKRIESKFTQKNGKVFQKRILKEMKAARKRMQIASNAGLRGAKKRWGGHNDLNTIENETKSKRNKNKISISTKQSPVVSSSLRLRQAIEKLPGLTSKTQGDRTAYNNLCRWIEGKVQKGDFTEEIYVRVFEYAKEAAENRNAQNKKAVFFSTLKRELDYKPTKEQP